MVVHILAPDGTEFGINRCIAHVGFELKGEDVRLFVPDEFEGLSLAEDDIVFGGIAFAHRAMERLGISVPALDPIPPELVPFAGRRTWRSTMGAVRKSVEKGEPVFVKPLPHRHKLFGGQLLTTFRELIPTAGVSDTEEVECAEPVAFLSEYRCFVLHGKLLGVRHYKGDPLLFPNAETIRAAADAYTKAPTGYALDMGVTGDGQTRVVEINDGYSSAAYGLPPMRYASVIAARWGELRPLLDDSVASAV